MRNIIYILAILLFSITVRAASFSAFDTKPLYDEPLAYSRSPDSGITINTTKYHNATIGYLEASLGHNLPIITMRFDDVSGKPLLFQFGATVGFWATLGYDAGAFPLLTQDFLMAAPLSFKWGNISGAFKYNHISAHLGDGFDKLLENDLSDRDKVSLEYAENLLEDFTGDDDVGIILKDPFSYSRDFLSLHISFAYKIGELDSRIYYHAGYTHKMIPKYMKRAFAGSGFEIMYSSDTFSPYCASDITYNQDTNSIDWASELGAKVFSKNTKLFSLRIAATMFIGKDRRGQIFGEDLRQYGVGLFIY